MFTHPRCVGMDKTDKAVYATPRIDEYPLLLIKSLHVVSGNLLPCGHVSSGSVHSSGRHALYLGHSCGQRLGGGKWTPLR